MRVYASPSDLENYTGEDAPEDAQRRLARASEAVDDALMTSVYTVDVDGYPTLPTQREAVRDATCAVVEWWSDEVGTGDEVGVGGGWGSVKIGSVSLTRSGAGAGGGSMAVRPGWLPPRALGYLQRANLLPGVVFTR